MRPLAAVMLFVPWAACAAPRHDPADAARERDRDAHPNGVLQRALARRGADATMPHDALVHAWQQKQAMAAVDTFGAQVQWTWLGPGNVGGRLRAVLIDPTNPQRIWVGSAGGGVWYSDTAGASWQPRNGLLTMLGCGCMALDPANPDHLYFGSGEGFFDAEQGSSNTAILQGAGIFESLDAGVTWARISSTATPDWYFVNRLAFRAGNPLVMLAATGSGIWRSVDGGQTWSQRTTERALDVDFHPTDPNRAVAGRADGRALWSTDGGLTWTATQLSGASTRVEIAYARSNPGTVFAAVANASGQIDIWRSLDGGQTWALRSTQPIATYSLYNVCLWVDPTNANNLVHGGVQIYRSTDAGATSTQMSTGAHPDYHVVVEHPGFDGSSNRRIYAGDDGGLHTRADWSSGSWSALNNGLGVTQFYGAAMNATSGVMVAGAQDNGTNRFTGNRNAWAYNVIGGDGGFCAADPSNPSYFYGGYQYLGLQRSSNGGVNWSDIRGATTGDPGFNFIPYFLLDPNDPNRMLACGRALWRTNNVRTGTPPSWTQVKAPRFCPTFGPAYAHFQDNPFCNLSTAQIAVGNSDLVWVGHNDGELYRTTNGTAGTPTWTLIDGAGGTLPDRWISSIAIDPQDHQRVLVSLMGYTPDNLWETLDGGANWHTIDGSGTAALPDVPVSWVLMHPTIRDLLFVATDLGPFVSTDGGGAWAPAPGGPDNVCIDQLVWKSDRELLCVTHGRGVYLATLPIAGSQPVGAGCAAATPPVLTASAPVVGTTIQFAMSGARPNAPVLFAVDFGAPLNVPVGPCEVHVAIGTASIVLAAPTSAAGAFAHPLPVPPQAWLVGVELTAQTLVLGAGGPMLGIGDLSTGRHVFLGL